MPSHPMLLFSYQACLPTAVAGSLAGNLSSISLKEGWGGWRGGKEMGDVVGKKERQGKRKGHICVLTDPPHPTIHHRLAFTSPATHNFLTLMYEWDSITLMPNINCSRFSPPIAFSVLCVVVPSLLPLPLIHKKRNKVTSEW